MLEEEAASQEEVVVEDLQRFFRPCRWIKITFMRIRVLMEGALAVSAEASDAEDVCIPGGAVVGREVVRGRLYCHNCIGLVWRSGG